MRLPILLRALPAIAVAVPRAGVAVPDCLGADAAARNRADDSLGRRKTFRGTAHGCGHSGRPRVGRRCAPVNYYAEYLESETFARKPRRWRCVITSARSSRIDRIDLVDRERQSGAAVSRSAIARSCFRVCPIVFIAGTASGRDREDSRSGYHGSRAAMSRSPRRWSLALSLHPSVRARVRRGSSADDAEAMSSGCRRRCSQFSRSGRSSPSITEKSAGRPACRRQGRSRRAA